MVQRVPVVGCSSRELGETAENSIGKVPLWKIGEISRKFQNGSAALER